MAFTQRLRTPRRWAIRRAAPRAAALAVATLVLSLILAAIPGSPGAAPAHAQFLANAARPGVTVYGSGEASAPAETATVQLLIGQGGRQFGFSQDGSTGTSFESAGVTSTIELVPAATPEAGDDGMAVESADSESRRGRRERLEPQPITAERLAPIIEAVATSAGIEPDAVTVNLSPLATEPFGRRQESARIDFDVAQPNPAALAETIAAASDAASRNGMVIEVAGVLYNPTDCAAIEDEAAMAAIADARAQAERLAVLLEVTLGDVIAASSDPYLVGFLGPGQEQLGCTGQQSAFYDSSYGGLGTTVPVFDPSAPAEVEVYAVLAVSFEIVRDETG